MQTNFEMIERYIEGELGGKELYNFQSLLSTDTDIQRNYNLSLQINNSIIEDDVMALRETMQDMFTNEPTVKRMPKVFATRRLYYAAATIILLIVAGIALQRNIGHNLSNTAVYDKYYKPYDVTVSYRSGNSEVNKILLNALERYEEKDYEHAVVLFEKVLEKRQDDMAVRLYSGISYMEDKKYMKATKSFIRIISNGDNLFFEQAQWYLSLCYLRTNKLDKAVVVLNKIIEEDSYYKKQADKVLKDLGR